MNCENSAPTHGLLLVNAMMKELHFSLNISSELRWASQITFHRQNYLFIRFLKGEVPKMKSMIGNK